MEQETLKRVADTTLQVPVMIEVDIIPKNKVHGLLQKWGVAPKKRVFTLKPIVLGSLVRISKLMLTIDFSVEGLKDDMKNLVSGSYLNRNYHAISKNSQAMAEIIAIAIRNSPGGIDKRLVKFIMDNFTTADLAKVLLNVVVQMDVKNFTTSIISIRGLNVLQAMDIVSAEDADKIGVSL